MTKSVSNAKINHALVQRFVLQSRLVNTLMAFALVGSKARVVDTLMLNAGAATLLAAKS